MAEWKKIVTSGSTGVSINATEITLGANADGTLPLTNTTTIQNAITQINGILGNLAPASPSNLSDVSLTFVPITAKFNALNNNLVEVSNITSDTTPTFQALNFMDGDNGTLSVSFSEEGGAADTFIESGSIALTENVSDVGFNTNIIPGILQIIADEDPYDGQAGSSGFYKQLTARINITDSLPVQSTADGGDYTRRVIKLSHSTTGNSTIEFNVDSDSFTSLSNKSDINSINNAHSQSGITYLGDNSTINISYTVTIANDTNYINTSRILSSVQVRNLAQNISFTNETTKIINTSWSPDQSIDVSNNIGILNTMFSTEKLKIRFNKCKASTATRTLDETKTTTNKILIDSIEEDETKPDGGNSLPTRVNSGINQFPSYDASDTSGDSNFGKGFDSSKLLSDSNYFELQFSNGFFHFPAQIDYSSGHTPAGPNYSSLGNDSSNSNLRYATFKLGDINNAVNVSFIIQNCFGFDSSFTQTSDGFQLALRVINTSTNTAQTGWINANKSHDLVSPTTTEDGIGGLSGGDSTISNEGNYNRTVTFGGPVITGTVFVRIGFNNSAGTDPTSTSTRKFNCIKFS